MVQAIPKPRTVSVLYPGSVQRTQSAEATLSLSASTLMHTHTCPLSLAQVNLEFISSQFQ